MKKFTAAMLSIILCFGFVSCGGNKTDERSVYPSYSAEDTSQTQDLIDTPEIMESTVIDEGNLTNNQMIITGTPDPSYKSGFAPLKKITYKASDATGLSTEKISHSHGPASGGKAHHTVLEMQKAMEKYKAFTVDTSGEKVLYLTFDCGYEYENLTSKVLDVLKEKGVTATFFCTLDHIRREHDLIARMIKEGHIVGNHSANHADFAEISRQKMADEILECDNYLRKNFGYATTFFRFPEGSYNENALELIDSMGYTSVFWSCAYADWDVNAAKGGDYAFTTVTSRLHPGAIILLHSVSPDNAEALGRIIDYARQNGYEFKALTDYKFA